MMSTIEPIFSGFDRPEFGAFVHGTPEEVLAEGGPFELLTALKRFNVLIFPEVHMSDETFLELTAALGEKHGNAVHDDGSEASNKGIFRIALDKDEQIQRDIIRANNFWHMDGMNYASPNLATLLKCQRAPNEGGDTGFADLHAAYDALPDATRARIRDLKVGHCIAAALSKLYDVPASEDIACWNAIFPRTERPLVWTQSSGRSSLLIGSTANDVVEMCDADGKALLEELLEWATQDRFTYRHAWKDGDLVIFHNPALLHRSFPYSDAAGRVMHRTTLKGQEAFDAASEPWPGADLY